MGTGSFPGVKRPGRGADHPPPSKCRGHERVELYLYSPSAPQWPVIGRTLLTLMRLYIMQLYWPSFFYPRSGHRSLHCHRSTRTMLHRILLNIFHTLDIRVQRDIDQDLITRRYGSL